jgi:hypothetical protein
MYLLHSLLQDENLFMDEDVILKTHKLFVKPTEPKYISWH